MTLAVIGSSSMVGSRFCQLSKNDFIQVLTDLPKVDITETESVDKFVKNQPFEWLILFSAYTDVEAAEKQRNDQKSPCWQINVEGVKNVVGTCKKYHKKLLFISTDFVFDGASGPYNEDDPVGNLDQISWYGLTKLEAEKTIQQKLNDFLILRISYPYRGPYPKKADFAKTILAKHKQGQLFPLYTDQILTPTFVDDLAPAVKLLIKNGKRGIFHVASPLLTTPYDFAKELLTVFTDKPTNLVKGSIANFSGAPRPRRGGLKVTKIEKCGFRPTDWRQGIKTIYKQSNGRLI